MCDFSAVVWCDVTVKHTANMQYIIIHEICWKSEFRKCTKCIEYITLKFKFQSMVLFLTLSSYREPLFKVAFYCFPKQKIKILKSVKLKQQHASCELLVTAIDVKFNFTWQINAAQGKMINIVTKLLEGDWKLDISNACFSKPSWMTRVKILEINKQYEDKTVNVIIMKSNSTSTKINVFAICRKPVWQI